MSASPTPRRPGLSRRGRIALLAALAVCGIVAVAAYGPAARWYTRDRGEHLSATAAQKHIPLALPQGASDVRYYLHTQPDRVLVLDFAVDEFPFRVWASAHGWSPESLRGSISLTPRLGFGDRQTTVVVSDGYAFSRNLERAAPDAVLVVYDRTKRRAYYGYWSAPQGGDP